MSDTETLSPEKRAQILTGANTVFSEDGYEGASMARIAQVAGVSKGTLYNYFAGKAELFAAHIEGQCALTLGQVFAEDGANADDPAGFLRTIGTRMLEMMVSDKGLTTYRIVTSEAPKFPELSQGFYNAGPARAITALAGWLARQHQSGRLSVPDPIFAAEQFFSLCQARLCLRRVLHVDRTSSPEEIAHVVDAAVAMFLAGCAPNAPQGDAR